ncbi:glycosyltransferase family 25 protein [Prosthecomicrobium pneumaticum]|uniref:Glycosyl transferase family 25 n=1 Tax=Prosthecomicrobium pneumaticum TaxID=81895 RepID=A0A7W9L3Q3_9HYPH|nr:glycosyl transferase family 25 [Prosthecomicrobium pneumaticum]
MICYLINLDRHAERRARMEAHGRAIGLTFERVAAVDAAETPGGVLAAARSATPGAYHLSDPEVACTLSHRIAWRRFLDTSEPYAAIFEDDVTIAPVAAHLLARTGWIPADARLVKLETFRHRVIVSSAVTRVDGLALRRLASLHFGTAGYILDRAAAALLLAVSERLTVSTDNIVFQLAPFRKPRLVTYQLDPAVVVQMGRFMRDTAPAYLASSVPRGTPRFEKRKGLGKLAREIARPVEQLARFAVGPLPAYALGYRPKRVPFLGG